MHVELESEYIRGYAYKSRLVVYPFAHARFFGTSRGWFTSRTRFRTRVVWERVNSLKKKKKKKSKFE